MNKSAKILILSGVFFASIMLTLSFQKLFFKEKIASELSSKQIGSLLESDDLSDENIAPVLIDYEASYEELSLDEMILRADLIFLGRVDSIFSARWNQDSGKHWDGGGRVIPFHNIDVNVIRPLAGEVNAAEEVVVTVIGSSPVETNRVDKAFIVGGEVAHDLQVGDERIFFLVNRELAWQNGTQSIKRFMGDPQLGYLKPQEDQLCLCTSRGDQIAFISWADLETRLSER